MAANSKKLTYRDLLGPLPTGHNLAHVASIPFSRPCERCLSIRPDRDQVSRRGRIYIDWELLDTFPDFPILKSAGKTGCTFCRLVRKTIRANWSSVPLLEDDHTPLEGGDHRWDLVNDDYDGTIKIHGLQFSFVPMSLGSSSSGSEKQQGGIISGLSITVGPSTEPSDQDGEALFGHISKTLHFKVYDSIDLDSPDLATRRQLLDNKTLSQRNVQMMKEWITGCETNHAGICNRKESWTPTRLLDLGPDNDSLPRIEEFSDHDSIQIEYAALSHAWGDDFTELCPYHYLESNLEGLKQGIENGLLNASLRDAIAVCRALDIRYLWIDSLCIVRDSVQDLTHEFGLYHKIFGHARVTIAAASAANPSTGFLCRNLESHPAAKMKYGEGTTGESLVVTPVRQESDRTGESDIESSLLNQHGWAMIERTLSSRIIYFCQNKLYFECRGSMQGEDDGALSLEGRISPLWPRTDDTSEDKAMYNTYFHELWRSFVIKACKKRWPSANNRLVGINNIASEMESAVEDFYLPFAGMWYRDLPKEMLWYPDGGERKAIADRRAPTWSWGAIDAEIGFYRGDTGLPKGLEKQMFAVQQLHCEDNEASPGNFAVEVTGYCREISRIRRIDEDDEVLVMMREEYPFDLVIDGEYSEDDTTPRGVSHDEDEASDGDFDADAFGDLDLDDNANNAGEEGILLAHGCLDLDDDDDVTNSGKKFFYLHVNSEHHPTGLVLAQEADNEGVFTRVGVATIAEVGGDVLLNPPFERSDYQSVVLI